MFSREASTSRQPACASLFSKLPTGRLIAPMFRYATDGSTGALQRRFRRYIIVLRSHKPSACSAHARAFVSSGRVEPECSSRGTS
jgi:hypothetical protein